MQKDKYVHTDKDKQDDLLFIRRFSQTFEDKFSSRLSLSVYNIGELDGLDEYLYCVFDDVLHQAETVYAMNTPSGNEMIWITTGINPNGVTNNLIARTYNHSVSEKSKWSINE